MYLILANKVFPESSDMLKFKSNFSIPVKIYNYYQNDPQKYTTISLPTAMYDDAHILNKLAKTLSFKECQLSCQNRVSKIVFI